MKSKKFSEEIQGNISRKFEGFFRWNLMQYFGGNLRKVIRKNFLGKFKELFEGNLKEFSMEIWMNLLSKFHGIYRKICKKFSEEFQQNSFGKEISWGNLKGFPDGIWRSLMREFLWGIFRRNSKRILRENSKETCWKLLSKFKAISRKYLKKYFDENQRNSPGKFDGILWGYLMEYSGEILRRVIRRDFVGAIRRNFPWNSKEIFQGNFPRKF